MLTLYVKTGCPFCLAAQGKANELGLDITEKNIADENNLNELMEKGGKRQVPFLVDDERNVKMYESADIVEYFNEHYGDGKSDHSEGASGDEPPKVCPA